MATKLPWVELFKTEDGSSHIVKCRICIKVEKKDILFAHKWDFFMNMHIIRRLIGLWGLNVKKSGLVQ
jgi:hypothetical protein